MKSIKLILSLTIYFQILNAQSEDCKFLLSDGIRNFMINNSYEKDYNFVRDEICKAYNSYKLDKSVGNASAKFKAIFKGKASYSRTEIEAIGEASCNKTLNVSDYSSNQSSYSEIIDPNWAKLIEQCIASNNRNTGVSYKIEQSVDGYLGELTITVKYKGTDSGQAPTVTNIEADSSHFELSGNLKVGAKLTESYTIRVKRKNMDRTEPIFFGGKKVLNRPAIFLIGVSNGENLNIVYPEIPYEQPIVINYGVGEVVTSMLDVETFLRIHNKEGQLWVLAAGQEVQPGTSYRKYLDDNFPQRNGRCPDLRGLFLRGKNHDRDSETGNPEGDLEIGYLQMDMFKEHKHTETRHDENPLDGQAIRGGHKLGNNLEEIDSGNTGGIETRPRNVTVNYFIRIN